LYAVRENFFKKKLKNPLTKSFSHVIIKAQRTESDKRGKVMTDHPNAVEQAAEKQTLRRSTFLINWATKKGELM